MLRFLKEIFCLITLAGPVILAPVAVSGASFSPSLEPFLSNRVKTDSLVPVVVFADDISGSVAARKATAGTEMSLKARHKSVIENLQSVHTGSLKSLKDGIQKLYPSVRIKEYWIAPVLSFDIPSSKLTALAHLPGIASVFEDAGVEFIEPVEPPRPSAKFASVFGHLQSLNIPALWKRGLTGKGRLVCNFDTGVEGSHPALESKWRGRHAASSASWFATSSPDTLPFDKTGHGTHTMGLMVGSIETDSFGVAPDAEWIGAAVIDQGYTLSRTISDIIAAFEWAVDPDGDPSTIDDIPDVILNSWGVPTSIMEPCDETFYQVIDNVELAGVVTIFAAGNEGPDPQSLRIPANRATSPLNSFAVGAIDDATNIVAGFSSRGPSSCDTSQLKPEVVAPGVNIYSSTKGGGYTTKSGTSMAAPLIAGMVALLRQYNPDATVDEIKNAIIMSARDLGQAGEDNDYGHGLPDAETALAYMPVRPLPDIYISHQIIGGDGIAEPGETFDFFVRLEVPAGGVDSFSTFLHCADSAVDLLEDHAVFIFGLKGTSSINITPFVMKFSAELLHGQNIPFSLYVHAPFDTEVDTIDLEIIAGYAPNGNLVTHVTPQIELTVTDFGQFGLGSNSIYPAGGTGFTFQGSTNLLYEAGIIVGRNELQLSSSVRDSLGKAFESDFCPVESLTAGYSDIYGCFRSYSRFRDLNSAIPIPIEISQSVYSYEQEGEDDYLIMTFNLVNNSNEYTNGLYFGLLTDFDLSQTGDQVGVVSGSNMLYQSGDMATIGLLPLTDFSGMASIENEGTKIPLTSQEKFTYISYHGIEVNDSTSTDFMTVLSFGPFNLTPHDSVEVSLAMVAAGDLDGLQIAADHARARYFGFTDVAEEQMILPEDFTLHQNYPNPFNPVTTISFDIARTSAVELTVFNMLGQTVATIFHGIANPGSYDVTWDGQDDYGNGVASGVYFYRLKSDPASQTRKMLFIK